MNPIFPPLPHSPATQELANDPLGILRPPSKLQHALPLASAYAAAATAPTDADHAAQRQRRRIDPGTTEPRWGGREGGRGGEELEGGSYAFGCVRW